MLKLKQVSKFYYNKGIVASGFSKVNLDFDLGEFVAITGESGSGKSTLLNVIAGLDSYEEGEMYINDNETSHYTERDYESYRRKYIGNIFQNFNLVNSYTVYQNIELVLLLNGEKKKDIKQSILEIIKQVDLYRYRNTRVSKLSGGQKQRVAIARALAKDTPIILADEPTGNLDSKSSASVLKLLHAISKDKLVIIVTHNYEQVLEYVTRKITMHDGRVTLDKKIKEYEKVDNVKIAVHKETTIFNKLRLGIRNTFNIIPKFLLLLTVYLFVVLAFSNAYSSFKKQEYEASKTGYNWYFTNISDKRVIIKKDNKTAFTNEDYEEISKLANVNYIIKDDLLLDYNISLSNDNLYFYGIGLDNSLLIDKVDIGSLPKNDNEVVIESSKDNFVLAQINDIIDKNFYIDELYDSINDKKYAIKVVGIKYNDKKSTNYNSSDSKFYLSNKVISEISNKIYRNNYTTLTYTLGGKQFGSYYETIENSIIPNEKVPKGQIYISENFSYLCKNYNCKNYKVTINAKDIYYNENIILNISNIYTKKNFNKLTGLIYDKYNGALFINPLDYNSLFNNGYFQSSIFVKDDKLVDETIKDLNTMGIKTLYIKDTLTDIYGGNLQIIKIIKVIALSLLLIVLFFISYFIIKLILKSRNVYFSTLRILGSSKKTVKTLLNIELIIITNIAYLIFLTFTILIKNNIIKIDYLKSMYEFIALKEYFIIYLIIFIMSILIANRYARKLFKDTTMNTYKEEV